MNIVQEVTGMSAPQTADHQTTIRAIIVEDNALIRRIIQQLLARDDRIEVVGNAATGREGLELIQQEPADVALMDLAMPEMDGVEVLKRLREQAVETPVIIVSVHIQVSTVLGALQAGAKGYVIKSCITRDLIPAICTVCEGGTYFSESLKPIVRHGTA